MEMGKMLMIGAALALTLAACGSDDDSDSDGGDDAATPTQVPAGDGTGDDGEAADAAGGDGGAEADVGSDDGDGSGPSTATVTIDGVGTFEYSTEGAVVAQCLTDLFGIFSIQLPDVDGDGSFKLVALREGTDPDVVGEVDAVEIDTGDDDWVADEADMIYDAPNMEPGMSQVDSIEIDGRTVSGTATFTRQLSVYSGGEVETATGTFEATCGEERTT